MDINIKKLFDDEKIEYSGIIPFSECKVINESLLKRKTDSAEIKSAIVFLVPYYTGEEPKRNISLYAVSRDYHLYFKGLFERMIPRLSKICEGKSFFGFADNSPIGEVGAAAKAGLGIIGDKSQLINEKYGSYTFIGEIFTDAVFEHYDLHKISLCGHCGACLAACPVSEGCFSEMTQRKGNIDEEITALMKKNNSVWGCDICRTACPLNKNAVKTPIGFFYENRIPFLTEKTVSEMTKDEFSKRAYAWRGRKTILRNLISYEDSEN